MQAVRYFALMFSGASYTTAAFLQDSGLKRPFIITSDTGVLLGISFEVGQLGIEMSRPVTFRSKTFQGTLLTFCPILEIFGENLRLEECRMLGITDYFATITDDGKPGRALKIGWFLNEFFWDPGMNNSKGELPSSHISEVPLSFSSCWRSPSWWLIPFLLLDPSFLKGQSLYSRFLLIILLIILLILPSLLAF